MSGKPPYGTGSSDPRLPMNRTQKGIAPMKVDDLVMWGEQPNVHIWRVKGVHLGAVGVESLIELENVSHKPGWTGEWMTHHMMFVPECLLRKCRIGSAVD